MFWKNEICVYFVKWVISENTHLSPPTTTTPWTSYIYFYYYYLNLARSSEVSLIKLIEQRPTKIGFVSTKNAISIGYGLKDC
jgi:uncharacterized membrane protein YkgB